MPNVVICCRCVTPYVLDSLKELSTMILAMFGYHQCGSDTEPTVYIRVRCIALGVCHLLPLLVPSRNSLFFAVRKHLMVSFVIGQ